MNSKEKREKAHNKFVEIYFDWQYEDILFDLWYRITKLEYENEYSFWKKR